MALLPDVEIHSDAVLARKHMAYSSLDHWELLKKVLEIHDQKHVAERMNEAEPDRWCRGTINRWARRGKSDLSFTHAARNTLLELLPIPPDSRRRPEFTFIDLFAGIGGIRKGFESVGGECIFTSERDRHAVRTYKANHYCDPLRHSFNSDIREITLTDRKEIGDDEAYRHIHRHIPDHDVLLAGFPCQPFSLAGVSKKNALGRFHGFECEAQGTLFFDVARIIAAKRPPAILLENVKNLKSHDDGKTFRVICKALDELGYDVADIDAPKGRDPKIIDAANFVPQHRERIVLAGFRRDLGVTEEFTLSNIKKEYPKRRPSFGEQLEDNVSDKYILTPKLWEYLFTYAEKHRAKGNGFGFGLTGPEDTARTLSARYHKDGSEILVDRGFDPELDFHDPRNIENRPRRLTPTECARLMGFQGPDERHFVIPVSDTQAYRQFGNSVVVPVFEAVARLMKPRIMQARRALRNNTRQAQRQMAFEPEDAA